MEGHQIPIQFSIVLSEEIGAHFFEVAEAKARQHNVTLADIELVRIIAEAYGERCRSLLRQRPRVAEIDGWIQLLVELAAIERGKGPRIG